MSRAQQPSILSFFQSKQQPKSTAAPPPQVLSNATQSQQRLTTAPSPPTAPPLPPPTTSKSVATVIPVTSLPETIPTSHPSATIVPVSEAHIPALRRINALLLPVNYTESFYTAVLDPAASGLFSRAIVWQDDADKTAAPKVIGGVVCRIEPSPFDPATGHYSQALAKTAQNSVSPARSHALYIQSLALLAPYRSLGLATAAIEGIVSAAAQVSADRGNGLNIGWVFAHVWTENEDGLRWYGERGFAQDSMLDKYYWKLRPDSAWVVKRAVPATTRGALVPQQTRTQLQTQTQTQTQLPNPSSTTAAAMNLGGFSTFTTTPPPSGGGPPTAVRPFGPDHSLSFQNKRPDMEWNDLPEDMVSTSRSSSRSNLLIPPPIGTNGTGSGASSRSSSAAPGRKKKERAYPTAAFGS